MGKLLCFLLVLLWACVFGGASGVDAAKEPDDARLARPVTFESAGKRLHSVLEELSTKTGVSLLCGRNKND